MKISLRRLREVAMAEKISLWRSRKYVVNDDVTAAIEEIRR